jgi:hypothetical protein
LLQPPIVLLGQHGFDIVGENWGLDEYHMTTVRQ